MQLSLAGWSLHTLFRAETQPLALVDFPKFTRDHFGLDAVELNNIFFASREPEYLEQLVAAARQANVKLLNIAVDEKAADLASEDDAARLDGLHLYARWIPIAKALGCGAIRANSGGKTMTDRARAISQCTDSFRRLADDGRKHGVVILIENHWGLSADPDAMASIIQAVQTTHGADAIGALVDFGNWPEGTDRFDAMRKVLPFAKAVHAKVNAIDAQLNHPSFDLARCVQMTREASYDGYLGIEYEGTEDAIEGVKRGVRKLRGMIGRG